jgi:hypothetical protein
MRETIETWLQTPVTPADALPIVVMGGLLLVAIAGGLGAFRRVRKSQEDTREAGETLIDRLGLSAYCPAPLADRRAWLLDRAGPRPRRLGSASR